MLADPEPSLSSRSHPAASHDPARGEPPFVGLEDNAERLPPVRWTALHWLGMGLFVLPFVVIALTMALAMTAGGAPFLALVPLSFLGAFVGFAILAVATQRARRLRRAALGLGQPGLGQPAGGAADRSSRPPAAGDSANTTARRERRGMRGDHPNAPSVDYPEHAGSGAGPSTASDAERTAPVRCQHCGVWSVPIVERGARVCARCGAALPSP